MRELIIALIINPMELVDSSKLAILGGSPVLNKEFPIFNSIGKEEINAVNEVMESGQLSGYYGSWSPEFFGGKKVKSFEDQWCKEFKCKYSIAVNSNTSGLFAAMGAIGLSPGDEVIVPPLSMSATAISPLFYGGVPRFCDVEPITCTLDPQKVLKLISRKTKAIVVVNLFGHIAFLSELREIADRYNLYLIEDNAQAPFGSENDKFAGTVGDIGIFSLNYHKHFHTGEGGVCVTSNEQLAKKLQLIRNHGENCVDEIGIKDQVNTIGLNLRMTEICAAIGIEQLKKSKKLVGERVDIANFLNDSLTDLPGINLPIQRSNTKPVYYMYQIRFDEKVVGVTRETFSNALIAEGFPNFLGFVKPLYLLPVFQNKVALGSYGWPFKKNKSFFSIFKNNVNYRKGLCPIAEKLHEKQLMGFDCCCLKLNAEDLKLLAKAFKKVYRNKNKL